MIRRIIAVVMFTVLFNSDLAIGREIPGQTSDTTDVRLMLPRIGRKIDVKLKQKGSRPITGRLIAVSEDSFELQNVKSGGTSSEKIAFADVDSVKRHEMSNKRKALFAIGVLGGMVAAVLTALHFGFGGGLR